MKFAPWVAATRFAFSRHRKLDPRRGSPDVKPSSCHRSIQPCAYCGAAMKILNACIFTAVLGVAVAGAGSASAQDRCATLPSSIKVASKSRQCGSRPTVFLKGSWRGIFSAAFRWTNPQTGELEDRSPFALDDGSASSSPYKTQTRIREARQDVLCYGNFVRDSRFPLPIQLTIKRTVGPNLSRFCVSFTR